MIEQDLKSYLENVQRLSIIIKNGKPYLYESDQLKWAQRCAIICYKEMQKEIPYLEFAVTILEGLHNNDCVKKLNTKITEFGETGGDVENVYKTVGEFGKRGTSFVKEFAPELLKDKSYKKHLNKIAAEHESEERNLAVQMEETPENTAMGE